MTNYDLEEQIEPEQFVEDASDNKISSEVYKKLKEEKRYKKHCEKLNREKATKHKAIFHRIDNVNHYVCDNCGKATPEEKSELIYKKQGEYAYCFDCLKKLYPAYKPIKLCTTASKADFLSNHYDTKYFKGF